MIDNTLVANIEGRAKLYENTRADGRSLVVDIERGPEVTSLGTVVEVTAADGTTDERTVTARANYLSQNTRTLHFGLDGTAVERVRVTWPDGHEVVLEDVRTGRRITVNYNGTVD